ncbi:MAG: substrate-binding domain-containing protein, partial [Muribaculaceae bacterium]|nr:substrate-binding domain-containing protein [Muribaculaceae bacterium]
AKQIEDIRYFADSGFDILIVSPNEAAALTPIINEVYESGMPVIIFDRNIIGDSYTARIGVDDVGLGRSAAQYALQLLQPGAKAIEVYGLRGSTPAEDRHLGFSTEFKDGNGIILASEAANWREDNAMVIVDSLLDLYNNVDLI